jgi:ABC-type cobalt transport system substrate-binding protein
MKKIYIVLIVILGLALIAFVVLYLTNTKEPAGISDQNKTAQAVKFNSWEDLDKIQAPSSYEIKDIDYFGGDKDCCICSGLAAMMVKNGISKNEAQNFFNEFLPIALSRNVEAGYDLMKKSGLDKKIYVGYYVGGQAEGEKAVKNILSGLIADPETQSKSIAKENELLEILKKLVSINIPVLVPVEDDLSQPKSASGEIEDNTFILVTGYDSSKVIFYTLPGIKTTDDNDTFLKRWNLQDTEFKYAITPTNYTILFMP